MSFLLSPATVICADESFPSIRHAADILRRDMRDVLTGSGTDLPRNRIQVCFDASLPKEAYAAAISDDEILLRCGDDLGAVYALLSVSERCLGVQPLAWWNRLKPPAPSPFLSLQPVSWSSPKWSVRYRCWFVNDEVLFTLWHTEEAQRAQVWKRVFETILRMGGNMVIPGTDRAYDGPMLCKMALDMGLWLTQHHTEILGARMFSRVYPDLQPSFRDHAPLFQSLWQEAIDQYAGKRVVWAIGFRGQGDQAFWDSGDKIDTDEKRGDFISHIMALQMELVRRKDPDAVFCTNLYGEMMSLYRKGFVNIPPEVIRLWGDNGYGAMVSRRQNHDNPRTDAMPSPDEKGQDGIYYHVSFYDLQAANHITMLQMPPAQIVSELKTVLAHGADILWNINVGSLRPHLFMLDLVRRLWTDGSCDVDTACEDYAMTYYGSKDVAPLLKSYGESSVFYGPNPDDRAGDQFYHFPLRTLANRALRGEMTATVESLIWVCGRLPFDQQVRALRDIARGGVTSWNAFLTACRHTRETLSPEGARLLDDTLILQGQIHLSGCEGLAAFCEALLHLCADSAHRDYLQAYLWTDQALQAHRKALSAMRSTEGRFAHLYDNDCFAGVALTVQVLEGVRAFLRIAGDGEMLYDWEKRFLVPAEETRVTLQTHRTVQMTDDDLCLRLRGEVALKTR